MGNAGAAWISQEKLLNNVTYKVSFFNTVSHPKDEHITPSPNDQQYSLYSNSNMGQGQKGCHHHLVG